MLNPSLPTNEPVDALLTHYFRAEMPSPWPRPPAVPSRRLPSRLTRQARQRLALPRQALPRLALAASVALLLTGYLTLARWYPHESSEGLSLQGPTIGQKSARPHARPLTEHASPEEERPLLILPDPKAPR